MKKITGILVLTFAMALFIGCSASELTSIYTYGTSEEFIYGETPLGMNYITYSLQLRDNDTYQLVKTELTDMRGATAGVTAITSFGEFSKGDTMDGLTELSLGAADRILYSSYSTMGGYAFDYDTDVDSEFIIPGGDDQTITKEVFMKELGAAEPLVVYIALDSNNNETCRLALTRD